MAKGTENQSSNGQKKKPMKSRRRALQDMAFELATEAHNSGDMEQFTKLTTVFERMFQNDLKQRGISKAIAPQALESKREELQRRLALLKLAPADGAETEE